MITLTINNSVCKISGLDEQQFKDLRDLLSYTVSNYQSNSQYSKIPTKRHLMSKSGEFPTGLLYLVEVYLEDTTYMILEKRVRPDGGGLFGLAKRKHQVRTEQYEAVKRAVLDRRGIIVAPTGFGKTFIIAGLIEALQLKTLVVVPSLELKAQLSKSLTGMFGSLDHIDIMNVDAIKIGDKTKYDVVIIDEFHHSGAKTYRKLNDKNWNQTYYKFGLTATPFRSKDEENILLESVLSKVIYEVKYDTAVAKGYIVPMEAYYVEIPKKGIKGNPKSWPSMYSELVVNNEVRNNIIRDIMLAFSKVPTICLVKEISHGEKLANNGAFNFINGVSNERYLIDFFNTGEIRTLIGTDGILGEGIDTVPAEVIIIAGLGKSRTRFMQGVGRGFRLCKGKESCKVIIVKDSSHKWTLSHYKEQVKILKEEYGVVPIKLEIN